MSAWRVGRTLGRTIYLNDEFVGVMDTRELADRVVRALRAQEGPQEATSGPESHEQAGSVSEPQNEYRTPQRGAQ